MNIKKTIGLLLLCAMLLSAASCGGASKDSPNETSAAETVETADSGETEAAAESATETEEVSDELPEFDFEGYEYRILTREISSINYKMNAEEENGETLNDAIYRRNRKLEERFNFTFTESSSTDANYARTYIIAGDDAFDMINARCTAAVSFFQEGLTYSVDKLSYVDLSKPWWDSELNARMTFAGTQYIALGAMNLSYYDFTHVILFNKDMAEAYNMENIYDTVGSGNWTYDKFAQLAAQTVVDIDGNGTYDSSDQYGYLAAGKQVMPCFWISADVLSVDKDESDIPYMAMGSEKFGDVFAKIFSVTRDNGVWYVTTSDENIPPECIEIFKNDRGLFMDCTLYFINSMRDMETDFGVLPYPKWDESQDGYRSRVEFYDPTVVPITNSDLERTGVIIEAMCAESYKTVIPAYYEVALKTKYSRDEDSSAMLDLIFETRVIDLGDTVYVDLIRDKVIKDMFKKDNRDLSSKIASMETSVNAEIEKTLDALNK